MTRAGTTSVPCRLTRLGVVMSFGPLGPRPAPPISKDLRSWRRLGPVHFEYQPMADSSIGVARLDSVEAP
jgi:hypothetical protein